MKFSILVVIGVGGGVDIMMSLAYNAKNVTAVEINPAMHRMVTEEFDDYLINALPQEGYDPLAYQVCSAPVTRTRRVR